MKLFTQALFHVENYADDGILVFVNKKEALDFVQESIENEDDNVEKFLALSEKLVQM